MDDPNLEKLHLQIRAARVEIDALADASMISDDIYWKALIALAYEYANSGYPEDALILVMQIPASYYGPVINSQMEEDPDFKVCAEKVATVLVAAGYMMTSKKDNSNVN